MMEFTTEGLCTIEGKPFVALLIDGETKGQLTPGEAQQLGLRIIQSAIEAERDAGFLKFMLDMDDSKQGKVMAGGMLQGLREFRQQWDPEGYDAAAAAREAGE